MNRIYVQISTEQLKSKDRGRAYLAYLLIRKDSKRRCGGFTLDQFLKCVNLKKRAGTALLKKLVSAGFLRQESAEKYRVVAHKQVNGNKKAKYTHFSLSDADLSQFSLKYIASFRALLTEIEIERYKKHQRAATKGYSKTSERDGQREIIKNAKLREWHLLMAAQATAQLIGVSLNTAFNYRKRQSVSKYESKPIFLSPGSCLKRSSGRELTLTSFKGCAFPFKGGLLLIPVATRVMSSGLSRA